MFGIDVLQYRWLWASLLGGAALVMGFVLSYFAFWRQREAAIDESAPPAGAGPGAWAWLRSFVPWILAIVYAGFVIYAIVYTLAVAANPPNW
jgi:hypothetical protein